MHIQQNKTHTMAKLYWKNMSRFIARAFSFRVCYRIVGILHKSSNLVGWSINFGPQSTGAFEYWIYNCEGLKQSRLESTNEYVRYSNRNISVKIDYR